MRIRCRLGSGCVWDACREAQACQWPPARKNADETPPKPYQAEADYLERVAGQEVARLDKESDG